MENIENGITIVDRPKDCLTLKTKSNERLEFLGDGVLECITKYYLYRRFPKENEGFDDRKENCSSLRMNPLVEWHMKWDLIDGIYFLKMQRKRKHRTNLKKLGCLFEAFLGALFLDFNKITIKDEDDWFKNVFVTGPGFQIAQTFVESIFEQHVNWTDILQNDDNYKNILQVMIQKEFKITPSYMEISEHDEEEGYHMGVFICMGKNIVNVDFVDSKPFSTYGSFARLQEELTNNNWRVIYLSR